MLDLEVLARPREFVLKVLEKRRSILSLGPDACIFISDAWLTIAPNRRCDTMYKAKSLHSVIECLKANENDFSINIDFVTSTT